jgi:hypothetical protein
MASTFDGVDLGRRPGEQFFLSGGRSKKSPHNEKFSSLKADNKEPTARK